MIVATDTLIACEAATPGARPLGVVVRPDEGIHTLVPLEGHSVHGTGTLLVSDDGASVNIYGVGQDSDMVRVLTTRGPGTQGGALSASLDCRAYIRIGERWIRDELTIVPVQEQLYSRFGGLLETDVRREKRVLAVGLGSGGSPAVAHLVQSGVMQFDLIDPDRLEIGNIMRHVLGVSDVGRFKTKAMAEFLRNKNPCALVRTWEQPIGWDSIDLLRSLVKESDVVLGGTDNRLSKVILNRICVEESKTLILGTAFRRAYGGQVLRIRPGKSLCYQCFLQTVPEQAKDQEIASAEQAERIAYSDRPVPVEPGLSLDIAPLSHMVAKLALMELLRGTQTTLASLYEDFVAPLYIWTNRREPDTDYAQMEPLGFDIDGMHVMRWYGAAIPRNPGCPVCGDFIAELSREHHVAASSEDLQFFGASSVG
ncbi:MAG: ThiF family adenylyltransferase [Planctomycetes bacterium]|nr:ThiF family adenylyltransferase [Planctomycetota bacterium]